MVTGMTSKLLERWKKDPFDDDAYMTIYSAREMEVDGIFGRAVTNEYREPMITIKTDLSDSISPMWYVYDGYEIDEEHYVKTGCLASMTPNEEDKFFCSRDHR